MKKAACYHKPFKGAAHGSRYTYTIASETLTEVRWVRSDGLRGKCSRDEWDRLYVLVPKAKAAPAKGKKR